MIERYPMVNRVEVFLNITNQIQMCTMLVCISARYWKVRLGSGFLTPQAQWRCYFLRVVLCKIQQTDLSTCTATKVSVWSRFLHVDSDRLPAREFARKLL